MSTTAFGYDLPDNTLSQARLDVSAAVRAAGTQYASETEPSHTYPHMIWFNPSDPTQLFRRNAANDGWLSIGAATYAQAVGGADNSHLMTPLLVAQAIAARGGGVEDSSFGGNGFIRFKGGFQIVWGKISAGAKYIDVTFPEAFQHSVLFAIPIDISATDAGTDCGWDTTLFSATQTRFRFDNTPGGFAYIAIGY